MSDLIFPANYTYFGNCTAPTKIKQRIISHITKLLELIDKLAATRENIIDNHISVLFLCSLLPTYYTMITALEARTEVELTVSFIKSLLTDGFRCRVENLENSEHDTKAYKVREKSVNTLQQRNKFCSYCKMKNHSHRECWFLK